MIQLVLTVCSLVQGASCHEVNINYQESLSIIGCVFKGQVAAASYVREHPNYYVTKYKCGKSFART